MEGDSDGLKVCPRNKLIRTDSKKSSDASESESESQYVDCEDCESEEDRDDIDEVDGDSNQDDRDGLEFEYEPGISLSSLHFYQTCECQNNESESGEEELSMGQLILESCSCVVSVCFVQYKQEISRIRMIFLLH